MKTLIVISTLMLTACGVDGEPVQPTGGLNVNLSGNAVDLGANLGLNKGPLNIGLGL